jgi:class 3 adenylate cyclase
MECGTLPATLLEAPERRLVTIVLCDLPGLTAAIDAAHPEDVSAIQNEYHAVVGAIIDGHGGAVERIIGDDVAGVFGLLVSRKDDPMRAVHAALHIVGELKKHVRPDGAPLMARVGVHTAEALVRLGVSPGSGRGLLDGWEISMAARVLAAAPPGHVAVGALTQRLTAGVFEYEALPITGIRRDSDRVAAWLAKAPTARSPVRWTARSYAVDRHVVPEDARGAGDHRQAAGQP